MFRSLIPKSRIRGRNRKLLKEEESQARIKTAGRNINSLRTADDITPTADSDKELKMRVKEESEKLGLKLNIQESKVMASGPMTSLQMLRGKTGNSDRFYFLGLQNHCER